MYRKTNDGILICQGMNVGRSKTGQEVKDAWPFVGTEATADPRLSNPPVAHQKVEAQLQPQPDVGMPLFHRAVRRFSSSQTHV